MVPRTPRFTPGRLSGAAGVYKGQGPGRPIPLRGQIVLSIFCVFVGGALAGRSKYRLALYTHLGAQETKANLVCGFRLEKKNKTIKLSQYQFWHY